jgi:7,8-dihydropterin-6-yl-methyl-4-(beta-D-ribofuranosyl)aminobenzene 5'-phosphate synthase
MSYVLKAVVLNDNEGAPGLLNDWGWSLYIEYKGMRILFDADTRPDVIRFNAERLGVDLSLVDFAILSHHHYDHYGGFSVLAEKKPGVEVYIPPGSASWARGLNLKLTVIEGFKELRKGVWTSGPLRSGLWGIEEQALGIDVGGSLFVVVGCSHPGPEKLTETLVNKTGLKALAVLGGYHGPSKRQLDRLAELSRYVCPAHCSGEEAKEYVRRTYPEKYCNVRTGSTLYVYSDGRIEVKDFKG